MTGPLCALMLAIGAPSTAPPQDGAPPEDGVTIRPAAATEMLYNDAVDLLFREENLPAPQESAEGFGVNVDATLVVEARPRRWLSLRLRPEVFAQLFFNRADAIVVRLTPPIFVSVRISERVTLIGANEYVANLVPRLGSYTFQRDTAAGRLVWAPIDALKLGAEYLFRIKAYSSEADADFSSQRVGGSVAAEIGAHVRAVGSYAFQVNSGALDLGPGRLSTSPDGYQNIVGASLRTSISQHLLEASYQLRLARDGDPASSADQPLLSVTGALEEDTDELSSGGFDKHILDLTYSVAIAERVTLDLYGRFSHKSYARVTSSTSPGTPRADDLWLIGLSGALKLTEQLTVDGRALYRVNDSNDGAASFRNLILAVGVRWER